MQRERSGERRSFWVPFLIGVGVIAAVDEIVFHQLLAWHHFYDRATPLVGLISDGFLHAAELLALVAGFMMFSRLRQQGELQVLRAWAGFFIGGGVFQLFDGIVDHKLLRLHQIRYDVDNLLLYDLLWNFSGALLILVGVICWRRAQCEASGPPRRHGDARY